MDNKNVECFNFAIKSLVNYKPIVLGVAENSMTLNCAVELNLFTNSQFRRDIKNLDKQIKKLYGLQLKMFKVVPDSRKYPISMSFAYLAVFKSSKNKLLSQFFSKIKTKNLAWI